ncbi:hypothetical protein RJ639_046866 [Escallonia herrerae]|uniref:CCHC-type domain-containing protein n=1 Tax=Escallonia herrerae TaxID=1293975 RepID=A0AA88W822_9ASTE|nr:hypothetical protein RJ639_046866 [Escallonia herrerae]
MIAKNFKKFMRFRRNGGRRQQNASNEEKLCYKCHKPGHMKMDCPIYKREKKERRDVQAWELHWVHYLRQPLAMVDFHVGLDV